jgi:uncharacterized protein (TIGR03086 family)
LIRADRESEYSLTDSMREGMMAPSDQLTYQIQTLRGLVAGTEPEQLSSPTPCANWNVRALINHFVGGGHMFAAAFRGEEVHIDPEAPMPDLVGDDPVAAYDGAITDFCAAVDTPGAMDKVINLPVGQMPAPIVLEMLKFDLLVHCWDIARATGQNFEPPAELAEQGLQTAAMVISPEARDGDTFAAEVTPPSSASPIEKLVAFTGRSV